MSTVTQELELVRKRSGDGILRPVDVVDFARDPKTALHPHFEWDDSKAAEQYRLEQARKVIRCAVWVVNDDRPPIQAYVSLVEDRADGNSYRAMADVLSNDELREQLLAQAMKEAESWRKRYERLTELQPISRAIERVKRGRRAAVAV